MLTGPIDAPAAGAILLDACRSQQGGLLLLSRRMLAAAAAALTVEIRVRRPGEMLSERHPAGREARACLHSFPSSRVLL